MKLKIYIILILILFFTFSKDVSASETAFVFKYQDQNFEVSQEILDSWKGSQLITSSKILVPTPENFKSTLNHFLGREQDAKPNKYYPYKISSIYNYLNTLKAKIELPTIEPELVIENGTVVKFTPPQAGLKIETYKTAFETLKTLEIGRSNIEITTFTNNPSKSLSETNSLGINELIASGKSNFAGSPNNRRHNIDVGVKRFIGTIIPAGSEFSFNKILGPVEAEQGFLPELVIKKTGTVPEFGGGLCQVSSTTFRAAMEAGLPITQRRNHAYAVQYYAPQGTDATIYPGVIDLKFINDTPGAILVWPHFTDRNNLVFDFYGTKDTRQVVLDKPIQYDKKPDGSLKALWTRTVIKDGQSKQDEFKSVYQPPALFHKTEEFATTSSSPTTVQ